MLAIHRASRGDWLADGLADLLRVPVGDPFRPEVVAVPTRGVERWVSQRLSSVLGAVSERGDGVCANVEFPFPGTLIGRAVAAATDVDPDSDPWRPERAVWPLLEVVDRHLDEDWLATLAAHLGVHGPDDAGRRSRRWATVRHLADLFDRYAVYRPELVRGWADGAVGAEVPADLAWQVRLWMELRDHIGQPSPAERLTTACARLREDAQLLDLPPRCSVFGLTRLPASYLDVLAAAAHHRDIHLWLLHPSGVQWERGPDPLGSGNPLLVTWGRDSRDMQEIIGKRTLPGGTAVADGPHPDTLLGRIQADIRADRDPPGGERDRPVLDPSDRSLQVHACHGRARQVEVLRDAVLHLLADDPTLEPRDIIVLCPDIDAFAPLIQATFGVPVGARTAQDPGPGGSDQGRPDLHVRLADRSIRQTNPALGALAQLLDLGAGRVGASELLDLAGTAPVRRRFHLSDDDLARIERWVRDAGVRWGLDRWDRQTYRMGAITAGTWRTGLDRLLVGVTMSEDDLRLAAGVLPLDDVDSGDVELAGRLTELVSRLDGILRALAEDHPIGAWTALLADAAEALLDVAPADRWQLDQLRATLADVAAEAGTSEGGPPLTLGELRGLLADRLRGQPTRANFRTGHLTMCTLVPMRSVPHRVVCLLGLDDGVFPRRTAPDGDDLLARAPEAGDRDPRSEDRQLLLDALLAAQDHLLITYAGRDERTNAPRPPAVPVGELLDVVDRTMQGRPDEEGRATQARQAVVVHHPLQPYDRRNFVAGVLIPAEPWSFDQIALAGARASIRHPEVAPVLHGGVQRPIVRNPLAIEDLIRFAQHPVRAYLQQRLRISIPWDEDVPDDALPVDLDGLERWSIGDRMLTSRMEGVAGADCLEAELVRGDLPPGQLGRRALEDVAAIVEELYRAAQGATRRGGATALDVAVTLPAPADDPRSLFGTISDLYADELVVVVYSRLAPKHRMAAWVRLLALSAAFPDRAWRARTIGRGFRSQVVATSAIPPLGPTPQARQRHAEEQLTVLVDLYDRGMREALPLSVQASWAWVDARRRGQDPESAARNAWESTYEIDNEDRDTAHQLAFEGQMAFATLLSAAPGPDESGLDWDADPTRFGRLAHRLWDGLAACEELA